MQTDFSLKDYNTFHFNVKTRYFDTLTDPAYLKNAIINGAFDTDNLFILGGGSNVFFRENFHGLVLHPVGKEIEIIDEKIQDARNRDDTKTRDHLKRLQNQLEQKKEELNIEFTKEHQKLVDDHEIVIAAREKAAGILEDAKRKSIEMRSSSFDYSKEMLVKSKRDLESRAATLERNIAELDNMK